MALSRRELIRSGLLMPALGSFVAKCASAGPATAAIWVVDEQMPDAWLVGAEAQATAARVYSFSSDPGRLWFDELAPKLRSEPVSMGGYTSASTLFCLHYLAREHGLRLAAVGKGPTTPQAIVTDGTVPIDLRDPHFSDPRFSGPHLAYTWLMLPRRT